METLLADDYAFWTAQFFGAVTVALTYVRMNKKERKDFNLYHTYLCIPMALQFIVLQAWLMASLCVVGAVRTLLLYTDWGWKRRTAVVSVCLALPVAGGVVTASGPSDWLLLVVTVWAVSSEAMKSFLNLRVSNLMCTLAWLCNSILFGAYINAIAQAAGVISNLQAMERDFRISMLIKRQFAAASVAAAS